MAAGGIKNSAVLDELESHLREEVEQQMRAGTSVERAFEVAVKKIGASSALKNEFRKSTVAAALEKLMIAAAVLVVAFGVFLSAITLIFCYSTVSERLVGFIAMGLTLVTTCLWPALVPLLPVIHHKRKREAIEAAFLLAGFALCTFFVQLVLPHFEVGPDRIIPAVDFFGLFPIAVGFGIACGLERALRIETEKSPCEQ
jgi:hypothetical protein